MVTLALWRTTASTWGQVRANIRLTRLHGRATGKSVLARRGVRVASPRGARRPFRAQGGAGTSSTRFLPVERRMSGNREQSTCTRVVVIQYTRQSSVWLQRWLRVMCFWSHRVQAFPGLPVVA